MKLKDGIKPWLENIIRPIITGSKYEECCKCTEWIIAELGDLDTKEITLNTTVKFIGRLKGEKHLPMGFIEAMLDVLEEYLDYVDKVEREERHDAYREEHPKLLSEWKAKGTVYAEGENDQANVFISDGIADPDQWFSQEVRPLFILKEAYGGEEDWDEIEWFITGGHKQGKIKNKTWKCIADWAAYILTNKAWRWTEHGCRSEKYKCSPFDLPKDTWETPYLKQIAVINIKKYGGRSRSSDADLTKHAETHFEEIYRQIEMIHPTHIICGHTAWLLDIVWEKKFGKPIREERNSTWVYIVPNLTPEVKMLDYWHPSSTRCTINGAYRCIDYLFDEKIWDYYASENNENKDDE